MPVSTSPKIGFDRFISAEWAASALRFRAGFGSIEDLKDVLDEASLGEAALKKTKTVLNRLWLDPLPELSEFGANAVDIFKADPSTPVSALNWGMAIATYPFFAKVAELVGRLSALQGDCSSAEVHRRMSEIYGEREGTRRMTNMVIQSQASWGAIERVEGGKRLVRTRLIFVSEPRAVAWLVEAALRCMGKPVSVPALSSLAVLYPFALDQPIAYLASRCPNLDVRVDGSGHQLIGLRSWS